MPPQPKLPASSHSGPSAAKSTRTSVYRFYSLYGELLRRDVLETAMTAVAHHDGAPGVDGQSCSAYTPSDEAWNRWRDSLLEELRTKTYRPRPVRRMWIPKGHGKTRPLGIPTVKDRVVQTAVALLLLPIWETDSHPHSYAYRPKRNTHQAMNTISQALRSGRTEVIDADLSGYFDSIPHAELLRLVARRVSDGAILALLKAWLERPDCGTEPGHGLSPHYREPARHPARRRDLTAAGQPVSQPVGLASERTL